MDDVSCTGEEARLDACQFAGWGDENCRHYEDASVLCYEAPPPVTPLPLPPGRPPVGPNEGEGRIRLVGGPSPASGRVEIMHGGVWGTICDDSWDVYDALVVCRELGYGHGSAMSQAIYGEGHGHIWMDNVACTGDEARLTDCPFGDGGHSVWGDENCRHAEDAAVNCHTAPPPAPPSPPAPSAPPPVPPKLPFPPDGTVRLVGSQRHDEGRVEVRVREAARSWRRASCADCEVDAPQMPYASL